MRDTQGPRVSLPEGQEDFLEEVIMEQRFKSRGDKRELLTKDCQVGLTLATHISMETGRVA